MRMIKLSKVQIPISDLKSSLNQTVRSRNIYGIGLVSIAIDLVGYYALF